MGMWTVPGKHEAEDTLPNPLKLKLSVADYMNHFFNATIDEATGEVTYHG